MFKNLIALSFVILGISACGSHPTTAYVETNLQGVAFDTLLSSMGELEDRLSDKFLHDKKDHADLHILIQFGTFKSPTTLGQCACYDDECIITLRNDLNPNDPNYTEEQRWAVETEFRGVVIHELGHAFGLNHVKEEDEVMSPYRSRQADKPAPFNRYILSLHEARKRFFK
jgi:hypothetical protein